MKILLIIHNQAGTGPYEKVLEMAESLANAGQEITLLCTSAKNNFRFSCSSSDKLTIVESPDLLWGQLRQGIDLWNIARRILFLRQFDFDLIHAIDCRPAVILPALWLKWRKKIPLVLSWWDWFGRGGIAMERSGWLYAKTLGSIETFFEEYFRKYADQATVISHTLYKRLNDLGYPRKKIHLIRVGCKPKKSAYFDKMEIRKIFNLPEKKIIFCYAGTLYENDLQLLLNALSIIKSKCVEMPLTILIGKHYIEPSVINKLNIITTGYLSSINEVNQYMSASDYGLIPMVTSIANKARWPSKIGDYLSAGLPLLATPVSDLPLIFKKYRIGMVSKKGDADSYADILYYAVNISNSEYQFMHKTAFSFIDQELNWEIISNHLLKIYQLSN
ncbi:MAG: glycosyltransferase family 4 protein [Calditrichaceae bacterium]|nr:glycosyltransferase family 4 protein [Calditrichaceae bacterium]MBN2707495.1 glycosyltransferase family 4 protein [Calditrichaceae bacterium]